MSTILALNLYYKYSIRYFGIYEILHSNMFGKEYIHIHCE